MNFRRKLTSKLAIVATLVVMAALVIALVAIPAGALNQTPAQPGGGVVLNSPGLPPTMLNYQGYLTDAGGNPVNDTLEMTFSIYETAVGGTALWAETQPSVTVTDGLFNVLLGSINPIDTSHLTGESYLGITVGADEEMTPRQQIVSVAYAFHADTLDGMDSADFVAVAGDTMTGQLVLPLDGLVAGTDQLVLTGGKVGIGTTTTGNYKLYVEGGSDEGIYATGNTYGVYGYSSSYGVTGYGNYEGSGVYGYHSESGNSGEIATSNEGVYGIHSASGNYGQLGTTYYGVYGSGTNYGVSGSSNSGTGVYGRSPSGTGVYGWSSSGTGVYGRHYGSGNYGQLGSSTEGVYGEHGDSGNYGQLGTDWYGVYGYGTNYYGVYGESGYECGVYGYNNSNGNKGQLGTFHEGVYGYSSDGYGVRGASINNYGVYGYSSNIGVYGGNTSSGSRGQLGNELEGVYGSGTYGVYGYGTRGVVGYGISYDFYAAGPGINYGPFTGAHEVKLANGFMEDIRPGLIVSVTGETQVRTDEGEISYSSTLPTVKLADTPSDSKVFGVITSESTLPEDHWYQAGEAERFGIVNALGEGRVWVTNVNGDIEAGDYITTSAIAGYGQKQDDDLLHSYTLGKTIETVDWSEVTDTVEFDSQTYKAYPIAVVYTSG